MTTFAQWRSPVGRVERPRLVPNKYDIKVVDRFYAYCSAVAATKGHHDAVSRSRGKVKRTLWTIFFAGALLSYYALERLA